MAREADESNRIFRHQLGGVPEIPEINERRGGLPWRPFDPIVVENAGHGGTVVS